MQRGPLNRGWKHVLCIASGPSLDPEQKAIIRRECGRGRWRVIVTNLTAVDIPEADILFGADIAFWKNCRDAVAHCTGERFTCDTNAAEKYGLTHVPNNNGNRLSPAPGMISTGGNSGHAILSLAYALGATDIVMAGYDMQRTGGTIRQATGLLVGGKVHHHGPHPLPLANPAPHALKTWAERVALLAPQFEAAGVRVTNASKVSALKCFPREDLRTTLDRYETERGAPCE